MKSILILLSFVLASFQLTAAKPKPNLIFIMTDDQAWDALSGSKRFPFLELPNLERLAAEGAQFTQAFATTAICSPSRATCLTGLYSHLTGVPTNVPERDPDPRWPLVSELLQDAGYTTAFVGKWHMANSNHPRRGFDHWFSFQGQGYYNDPPININGTVHKLKGYTTDLLNEEAIRFISQKHDKPYALFLWHKAPHAPFTPANEYEKLHQGKWIPEPKNYQDDLANKPRWQRRAYRYGVHKSKWIASEGEPVPETINPPSWDGDIAFHKNYLRTLQSVDDGVGQIIDTLKSTRQWSDTAILYTSDNGMTLGAHTGKITDKRLMWEESIRIPLFMSYPRIIKPDTKIEAMTLNIDYVPTLLDVAGVKLPAHLQGRSLTPLFENTTIPEDWRTGFTYLYFEESYAPGLATQLGYRDSRYKYIHHPYVENDIDELYDLENDPFELENLYSKPEYTSLKTRMQTALVDGLNKIDYQESPKFSKRTAAQGAPNVLLITLDDLNYDSLGFTGCTVPNISPNLDKLASEGAHFSNAFVTTNICGPSRNAILTGLYPQTSGIMGHGKQPPQEWQAQQPAPPSVHKQLRNNGYLTGAFFKYGRVKDTQFDVTVGPASWGLGKGARDPKLFYQRTKAFIEQADSNQKPFFLYANPIDPHRPWPRTQMEKDILAERKRTGLTDPMSQYTPEETDVPEFLPDHPLVREFLSAYYDSTFRGDACIGSILQALEDSGKKENTLVIFLSDHGIPVTGGKWSLYNDSIRTPLIIRWPAKIPAGQINPAILSSIDIAPTILEACNLPQHRSIQGKSFLGLATEQSNAPIRDHAIASVDYFHASDASAYYPMRSAVDEQFLYIWNPFINIRDTKNVAYFPDKDFRELASTLAKDNPEWREKFETLVRRPEHELYDLTVDPGCIQNLATNPIHQSTLSKMQNQLKRHMHSIKDPLSNDPWTLN